MPTEASMARGGIVSFQSAGAVNDPDAEDARIIPGLEYAGNEPIYQRALKHSLAYDENIGKFKPVRLTTEQQNAAIEGRFNLEKKLADFRSNYLAIKHTNDDLIEGNMIGKYIKTCPHMFPHLKDYDYLCYLDSKLEHVSEHFVEQYVNKYFVCDNDNNDNNNDNNKNYALILRNHTFLPPDIWKEYEVSMEQKRYRLQSEQYKKYINTQVESGLKTETPYHCQCGFLIRNMKHPEINNIGETWFKHIQVCGIQDQISFFFVKQLFSDYILPFKETPFIIKPYQIPSQNNIRTRNNKSSLMKMITK
jgi:hypothetical protein